MGTGTRGGRRHALKAFAAAATVGLCSTARPWLGRAAAATAAPAPRPVVGAGAHDVTQFGAVGDGKTDATAAIQRAIDACAAAGGGVVLIPPGRYLSGALFLKSHIELHVARGAVLLASQRFDDFPLIDGRWEGVERKTHASLITGQDLENVAITGRGVLDGRGWPWWEAHKATRDLRLQRGLPREAENPPEAPLRWPRPRTINLIRCQGVSVADLTIRDGPSWSVHLLYCQDVSVSGLTVTGQETQGCDGVVVDSSKRVRIWGCSIGSGSDCIALKSGYNEDGRRVGLPCEDVVVSTCNLFASYGSGVAIGSETAGGVKNVTVANCVITNCRTAIYIRSPRGRGGVVERVRVSNLVVDHLSEAAIKLSHFFDSLRMEARFGEGPSEAGNVEVDRSIKPAPDVGTPEFRDIEFSGISIGETADVAIVEGLPERFIHHVAFRDLTALRAKAGISCQRAADVVISGLTVNPTIAPAVDARDVERLEVSRLRSSRPHPQLPAVRLENVAGSLISACSVVTGPGGFVRREGQLNRGITEVDNSVTMAKAAGAPR
jgi:hypothetical protein